MSNIELFDTTIRDGELSPFFSPTPEERLTIAKSLESAGVNVIELASTTDSADRLISSREISRSLESSTVCCLSRLSLQDLEVAKTTLDGASHPRIHLYLDAKRVHSVEKNNDACDEILEVINSIVGMAATCFPEVEFSPQDATRVGTESVAKIIDVALDAGAGIINVTDTVGSATPEYIHGMFSGLLETVPRLHSAKLSLHAHDNHGRATENALIAIECGALQIEGTINGVGPAGGNTNLVELSGILQQDKFCNQHEIAIDQDQLRSLSGSPLLQPAPATGRPASRI